MWGGGGVIKTFKHQLGGLLEKGGGLIRAFTVNTCILHGI